MATQHPKIAISWGNDPAIPSQYIKVDSYQTHTHHKTPNPQDPLAGPVIRWMVTNSTSLDLLVAPTDFVPKHAGNNAFSLPPVLTLVPHHTGAPGVAVSGTVQDVDKYVHRIIIQVGGTTIQVEDPELDIQV